MFHSKLITVDGLSKVIAILGYRATVVESPAPVPISNIPRRRAAPLPESAPGYFREAFAAARKENRPVVLDFWAEWCVPCVLLKEKTLSDPQVAQLLERVQLIYVDLDKHPGLGKAYGVQAVPHVFFIDRDGFVVDELRNFEAAESFAVRLRRLLNESVETGR